jgi:hypothetical protein
MAAPPERICGKGNGAMTDTAQRDLLPGGRETDASVSASVKTARDRRNDPPRSDIGMIILHWTIAIAFVISLVTGLRMATFGHVLPGFAQKLSPALPQGEMWTCILWRVWRCSSAPPPTSST